MNSITTVQEEEEINPESEQKHKARDSSVDKADISENDKNEQVEQKITVGAWTLYRPLDLDGLPTTIYSHVIADPSCFKVPLKLNGNEFSQEQLAECSKIRVGLNFSICETKVPRRFDGA